MNISLIIEQLVLEGVTLSRGERVELEESLQESLTEALRERAAAHVVPKERHAHREQMLVNLSENRGRAELAKSIGASLGNHLWDGQAMLAESQGQGSKR